ncbi:MAG: osmotically inducible protein OsmC [Gammaproteobacteria bacterium HGW-Gammaproteobacteria-14]|nr:MAG: osmotically inducible protein OsmC [Gammaproteobacteria bacterium HGW-Gammaproteobacteria-14]
MSTFQPTVSWHLQRGVEFDYEHYNRDHEWTFPGGEVVPASASTSYGGTAQRVNPDEAVVAATASCHMLTFLAIAAKAKKKVISYIDRPEGTVEKNSEGFMAITKIVLQPKVVFDDEVDAETLKSFHDSAHRHCFVSNSLKTPVTIKPQV